MKNPFVDILKSLFSFSWLKKFRMQIYPDPKEKPLKSIAEIAIYLILFGGCIFLYLKWNEVSYNEEDIRVECLNNKWIFKGEPHTFIPQVSILYRMPMTSVDKLKNDSVNIFLNFSSSFLSKYDSANIHTYNWLMYNDSVRKKLSHNQTGILENFAKENGVKWGDIFTANSSVVEIKSWKAYDDLPPIEAKVDSLIKIRGASVTRMPTYYYKCSQSIRKHFNTKFLYSPSHKDTLAKVLSDSIYHYFECYKDNDYLMQEGFQIGCVGGSFSVRDPHSLSLGDPGWFAMSDISQAYYTFHLTSSTIDLMNLYIDFGGACEFSDIYPEPDRVLMGRIEYTNPAKILIIRDKGLTFHVVFKELTNRQTIRVFFLTAIMSAMLTVFIAFFVLVTLRWLGSRKKEINVSNEDNKSESTDEDANTEITTEEYDETNVVQTSESTEIVSESTTEDVLNNQEDTK